jgi:hypothetical protein
MIDSVRASAEVIAARAAEYDAARKTLGTLQEAFHGDVRSVHVIASGEVRIVPIAPTATNCVPVQVTPLS